MNKPIYETIKTYGSNTDCIVSQRIMGYERVTRPGFSRKKNPVSMIKALEVRDRLHRKKVFYDYESWKETRNKYLHENDIYLGEEGGGTIGKLTAVNLETGEVNETK